LLASDEDEAKALLRPSSLIKPKVHLETYERQSLRWKVVFSMAAERGANNVSDELAKEIVYDFVGDQDELDHMLNSVRPSSG